MGEEAGFHWETSGVFILFFPGSHARARVHGERLLLSHFLPRHGVRQISKNFDRGWHLERPLLPW